MRLFKIFALATLATVSVALDYDLAIDTLYRGVCKYNQVATFNSDNSLKKEYFYDASIFQVVTGFALGTQLRPTDLESTCYE